MKGLGQGSLLAALFIFLLYFGDVALGASGRGSFLSDLGQMLTLFAAAICFVVGVLAREAQAKEFKNREE